MHYIKLLLISLVTCSALQAQNSNLSEGDIFDGEPFLAVDPLNNQHLVVAWMGYEFPELIKINIRTSFNGGNTWNSTVDIPHSSPGFTSADPSLDFDTEGNIYLCFIDYAPAGTAGGDYLYRSTDGGLSWNYVSEILDGAADGSKTPVDRPWMVIDRSGGSLNGSIYVTSKPAPWIPPPNRNYFTASINGGLSWSSWRYIDTTGWRIGNFIQAPMAAPCVSTDGIFYCIYPSYEMTESIYPRVICAKSNNAGNSFQYSLVHTITSSVSDTLPKLGYHLLADPSDPEHLAIFYIGNDLGDADIFMDETFSGGSTWAIPKRVNDDPTGNHVMQDLVWADFDADGNIVAAWRDRRNGIDTGFITSSEIWCAVRWKDSLDFSPNFRISDALVAYSDVLSANGNDFMSVHLASDTVYAAWGDTRDGHLNIWFTKVSAFTGVGTGIQNLANDGVQNIYLFPNPVKSNGTVFLQMDEDRSVLLEIYDLNGNIVLRKWVQRKAPIELNVAKMRAGTYSYRIMDAAEITSGKLVVIE